MAEKSFGRAVLRQVALAAPFFLLHRLLGGVLEPLLDNRLLLLALALPLAVACWLLWRLLARDRSVLLGGRFLPFFFVFALLFGLLTAVPVRNLTAVAPPLGEEASVEARTWRRWLPGEPDNPFGRLLPSSLADWQYRLAEGYEPSGGARAEPSPLLVVRLPLEGLPRPVLRNQLAFLVSQASRRQARGVALDFFFEVGTKADDLLCQVLEAAARDRFPVVVGHRYGTAGTGDEAAAVAGCVADSQRAHMGAIRGFDGRVRSLPVFLDPAERRQPAFAWRIASALAGPEPLAPPAGSILRFLRPSRPVEQIEELPMGPELERLRDRFVLVGSAGAGDRHATPWGTVQGVLLQAWATDSLLGGRYLRPVHPAWSFPTVLALCYLLTLILARGRGWRVLVAAAAGLSLAWLAVAALAVREAGLLFSTAPPLAAIWLLVALLLAAAGLLRGRPRREAEAIDRDGEATVGPFDVFLSYNGDDRPLVVELAAALEERGLAAWLDQPRLVPGRPWQEALEEVIVTSRTAAVLVGANGLGPWQQMEMRACLAQFVEHRKPVIPVLLPGAPSQPNLPIFLTQFTWVDLRAGLTPEGLDRLVWGITGRKPERRAAA